MKLDNNHTLFTDFIDSLTKDLDPKLTIQEAKEYLIANLSEFYEEEKNKKKALVFGVCAKEQKEWINSFSVFGLKTYVAENLGEITLEGLKTIAYKLILINVDSIFNELDKMLSYIRSEDSKNKDSLVFLVTNKEENLSKLERIKFDEKITLLSEIKNTDENEEVETV